MKVTHTDEIAKYLRELADKVEAMNETISADHTRLEFWLWLWRGKDDGFSNREAMAFTDRYAKAVGIGECHMDANTYKSTSDIERVYLFPLKSTPTPPAFDPDI